MGDGTKSKNDKTKEEKKIEKKEKQKKRKQQEKFEKDEQWKNMLDMQGSDKLNDVKVNVVTSDARKADESTKVYTVMSASQAKGLNPVIPIRVAKQLGRTRKEDTFEAEMFLDKEDSINYRAQDIQGKDISIAGMATLYIVKKRGWTKKI